MNSDAPTSNGSMLKAFFYVTFLLLCTAGFWFSEPWYVGIGFPVAFTISALGLIVECVDFVRDRHRQPAP